MSNFTFTPLQMAIKPLYEKAMAEDELFAKEVQEKESRTEKPKSLAECAEYIMGEAYKYAKEHRQGDFGLAGMPDADMIGLIKHYYDEDDIVIEKVVDAKPIVKTTTPVQTTPKPKKTKRPKETLENTHVPMTRPTSTRDAKKGSKEQAGNVIQMDIWGMLAGEDEEEKQDAEGDMLRHLIPDAVEVRGSEKQKSTRLNSSHITI